VTSGNISAFLGGTASPSNFNTGSKSVIVVAGGGGSFSLDTLNACVATIDNISVKEVTFDQPDGTLTLFNHPDNIPRIDYNPDGTVKGLLVEEARTNLATYSEDVTNAAWTKTNLTATSIDTLTLAAGTSTKTLVQIISSSATGRTVSFEAKEGTHRYLQLYFDADAAPWVTFDLRDGSISNSGTTVTGQSSPAPDGWFRYTVTTDSITATNVSFAATDIAATRRGVTASTGTLQLRRIQSEVGSFPTSYISTSGSTATRAADIASIPVADFGYNQDQGTVYVNGTFRDTETIVTVGSTTLAADADGEKDYATTYSSDPSATSIELNGGTYENLQYYPRKLTATQITELTT